MIPQRKKMGGTQGRGGYESFPVEREGVYTGGGKRKKSVGGGGGSGGGGGGGWGGGGPEKNTPGTEIAEKEGKPNAHTHQKKYKFMKRGTWGKKKKKGGKRGGAANIVTKRGCGGKRQPKPAAKLKIGVNRGGSGFEPSQTHEKREKEAGVPKCQRNWGGKGR